MLDALPESCTAIISYGSEFVFQLGINTQNQMI